MLRRKIVDVPVGPDSLPLEFSDVGHWAWSSVAATVEWCEVNGLGWVRNSILAQKAEHGPLNRRAIAIELWLLSNGFGAENVPGSLDWHRVRDLGLPWRWRESRLAESFEWIFTRRR